MCEFPKLHLFLNNSIPLSQQDVFWGGGGEHIHMHFRPVPAQGCWVTDYEKVGNCFSWPCLSEEGTSLMLESSQVITKPNHLVF